MACVVRAEDSDTRHLQPAARQRSTAKVPNDGTEQSPFSPLMEFQYGDGKSPMNKSYLQSPITSRPVLNPDSSSMGHRHLR